MSKRKLIVFISMSLDGYIATKDDDLSWLSVVESEGEDYGYEDFNQTVDTYLVGRKTYDVVKKLTGGTFPPAQRHTCYVITRHRHEPENGVNFYTGKIEDLIAEIRKEKGKNIYCDGGGQIVTLLMQKNLIDEYKIAVIPVLLGDGKRLFHGGAPMIKLKPLPSKQYDSGLIMLNYARK
ncbi:MAG TPA: dihydrofolate reductase [Flavobacteriales bacterium]|nr:dihydrofolate reductase [Flavobacteriales bacterium]